MDPDSEVGSVLRQENGEEDDDDDEKEEEQKKKRRPPSSYGSMKSESDVMEEEEEEEEEELHVFQLPFPPESTPHQGTGLQMIRSDSPETLYTNTTEQTRPPGAVVIDTRSSDPGDAPEDDEDEEEDELLTTNSPEPPDPVEPEEPADESSQPGRLHPEQDLPHIFKSIQSAVGRLSAEELLRFKVGFCQWESRVALTRLLEGDLLDLVDRMLEVLGPDRSLLHTIKTLESMKKSHEAEELRKSCKKALIRFQLTQSLLSEHQTLREGVVQAGRRSLLEKVFVEPLISTRCRGGVDPAHEFGPRPLSTPPGADAAVGLSELFRLRRADGEPVRTVVTTALPGGGMSVCVGKFCLDWAQRTGNQDLQFVFTLSLHSVWRLSSRRPPEDLTAMELLEALHPEVRGLGALEALHPEVRGPGALHPEVRGPGALEALHPEVRGPEDLEALHPEVRGPEDLEALHPEVRGPEDLEALHPEVRGPGALEALEACRYLIIMDSLDGYQGTLDWENAPVLTDPRARAPPAVLLVNIIRGSVLRGARVWILGRHAAVSQIPPQHVDVVTEIRGFSDQKVDEFLTLRFSDADLSAKIIRHYKLLPSLRILARQPFVCWMLATVFERCYRYHGYGAHPPRLTPFYVNTVIIQTNRRLQFYCGKTDHELKWSSDDRKLLTAMGKMALEMLLADTSVFSVADVERSGVALTEVTVFSGLCTELPAAASGRRSFCFIHFSFQEFMAALFVFTAFRNESLNVLDVSGSQPSALKAPPPPTAAGLVQSAVALALAAPPGRYDMFLRFLCGVLSPDCHAERLQGFLFGRRAPPVAGLGDARRLLERSVRTAEERHRDRLDNLRECLREMTQQDE
ncbi:uncharacterized protein nlrc3l [Pseudoliparis swirei]|uniref:uncharacterized protein nlrc3l n=1 Tax=Pseudoliparis swirei TaxID=2059687 RepID=UPI0024BE89C7|nr:uncharacterized protein nlrc3l [Pseudoliparis swirei]